MDSHVTLIVIWFILAAITITLLILDGQFLAVYITFAAWYGGVVSNQLFSWYRSK